MRTGVSVRKFLEVVTKSCMFVTATPPWSCKSARLALELAHTACSALKASNFRIRATWCAGRTFSSLSAPALVPMPAVKTSGAVEQQTAAVPARGIAAAVRLSTRLRADTCTAKRPGGSTLLVPVNNPALAWGRGSCTSSDLAIWTVLIGSCLSGNGNRRVHALARRWHSRPRRWARQPRLWATFLLGRYGTD